MPFGGP